MAIVKNSARRVRDYSISLFSSWYLVTRFTPTIIRILR